MKTVMSNINFEAVFLTALSFFMTIKFTTIISVIPSVLAIVWWSVKIKGSIDKYYQGSLKEYLKSLLKFKQKKL